MMKKLLLFSLLLVTFSYIKAQGQNNNNEDNRGYIGIGIGPSIPFGDFASTNSNNDDAGYAMTGGNLNITFGYRLGKNLGLSAMVTGSSNPINEDAVAKDFNNAYPQANWTIDADMVKVGGIMVGGLATFPAGNPNNFAFDIRLMVGALNFTSPEIRATASNGGIGITGTREAKTVTAGAFDVGFVFRYKIASAICLMANLDFISANPRFEDVTTTTPFGSTTSSFDQSYRTLNLTFGIGFLIP